jgi:hypothetical protein
MCWTGQGMRWAWAVLGMIWAVHGLGSPRSQLDMGWACDGLVWAFVSHRLGLPWAVISNVWTGPAMGCAEQTTIHSRQAMGCSGPAIGRPWPPLRRSAMGWACDRLVYGLAIRFACALCLHWLVMSWPWSGLALGLTWTGQTMYWACHGLGRPWAIYRLTITWNFICCAGSVQGRPVHVLASEFSGLAWSSRGMDWPRHGVS